MSNQSPPSDRHLSFFDGAVVAKVLAHPTRAFAVEVTFQLDHPLLRALGSRRPPAHFHPYQNEYFEVLEGALGVELEGEGDLVLGPEAGELCIPRWRNHRIYQAATPAAAPPEGENGKDGRPSNNRVRVRVSGEENADVFRLDLMFFENWYAYEDAIVTGAEKLDIIQVMCMWDAGGSYLAVPWWVPCGKRLSQAAGVVVGRWVGGLLGYRPYQARWTSEWEAARTRMGTCISFSR
ncbi:uncharacterized protein PG998_008461 [Apiospora kogelbergensis]|uniref:Cupin 2 conserved barrel domain-containing protein n=1 Tax=Apiospora kogelbergensis TaxID=1337665 RepID=A0AAW0QCH9_9PEZI